MSTYKDGRSDGYTLGCKRLALYGWDQFDIYFRETVAKVKPEVEDWQYQWNYGEGAKAGVREAWVNRRGDIE